MGKHRHHHPAAESLTGTVRQINFSPKGGIEGVLLDTPNGVVQVNLPPHAAGAGYAAGQSLTLAVEHDDHADHHPAGDHPVYRLSEHHTPDGPEVTVRVEGTAARLNYAKHGEPNGVVLDTGDFVHLKPHGMHEAGLAVGDRVTAEGTARPTFDGHRVIEATVVNGIAIEHKKKKHHDH